MQINDKAYNAFLTMFWDIDFSKSGYRPPLDKPLIFATLSGKTINILSKMGYEMRSNTLLASTQKQLLHGMRIKKQKDRVLNRNRTCIYRRLRQSALDHIGTLALHCRDYTKNSLDFS